VPFQMMVRYELGDLLFPAMGQFKPIAKEQKKL
jgi:hypothetical protein